jgi:Lrp/AsnC family transcriptional regulator for asnA, asnC and gidA
MLSDSDLRILRVLERDASLSYAEIARRLGLNESTVRKKVLKLKRQGIIRRFSVVLDPEKLGIRNIAILGIDTDPDKLLEVAQRLRDMPEVKSVAITSGDHMLMAEVWSEDGDQLSKILTRKIGKIDGVRKVCPSLVLERVKD